MGKIIPPKGFTQLVIKSYLFKICKGNECAAIILNEFDNVANGSKDEIQISFNQLRKSLSNVYSRNNVIKSLKELAELKLIQTINNTDINGLIDANGYILDYTAIQKAIKNIF